MQPATGLYFNLRDADDIPCHVALFQLPGCTDLSDADNRVLLVALCQFVPGRGQAFAVTTPRSVELDEVVSPLHMLLKCGVCELHGAFLGGVFDSLPGGIFAALSGGVFDSLLRLVLLCQSSMSTDILLMYTTTQDPRHTPHLHDHSGP